MILSGQQIAEEVRLGRIVIDPFAEVDLNPNSYNYHLGTSVKFAPACGQPHDPSQSEEWVSEPITPQGVILYPSRLYLSHTRERIGSSVFVPSLIGRSSVGRLGLFVQVSADLGQLGAIHCWTLELAVVQPLRIYAGMRIGQVSFWVAKGYRSRYRGEYAHHSGPREYQRDEELANIARASK